MRFFKSKQEKNDDEFTKAWNEAIDPTREVSNRKRMSTKEIAEKLSECLNRNDIKSPAYILLDYELKCRLEKVQNFPQYLLLLVAICGIFLGWFLPQWQPFKSKTSLDIIAEHIEKHDLGYDTEQTKKNRDNVKLPVATTPKSNMLNPIKQPYRQGSKDNKSTDNDTK